MGSHTFWPGGRRLFLIDSGLHARPDLMCRLRMPDAGQAFPSDGAPVRHLFAAQVHTPLGIRRRCTLQPALENGRSQKARRCSPIIS